MCTFWRGGRGGRRVEGREGGGGNYQAVETNPRKHPPRNGTTVPNCLYPRSIPVNPQTADTHV